MTPCNHVIKTVEPLDKPKVDSDVLAAIAPIALDDSYVYVNCHCDKQPEEFLIRIWKTTYLVDTASQAHSKLVHAHNISFAPQWTLIPSGFVYSFLLIFEGLPSACKRFDLVEEIAQPGGFHIPNLVRNQTDVYHTHLL
jgi:hypothetical protein